MSDPSDPPAEAIPNQEGAVFGYKEFWPKVYAQFKRQFDTIADLMRLGDEMVRAGEENAAEPTQNVVSALTRATMGASCEVVLLCGNGCGPGAVKIVRGMYESRWTAEYLRRHPDEVEDYLAFSKVLLWRRLCWQQEHSPTSASSVPHEVIKRVEDDYYQARARFTDSKGRERLQWSKNSIRSIAREVGREKEYDLPYAIACSIHHANFEGLLTHFASKDGGIAPAPPPSEAWIKQALVAAHTNLLFALETLNDSCGLDFRQSLDSAADAYSNAWKE